MANKESNNRYSRNAKKRGILHHLTNHVPTEGDLKNTAIETAKDFAVGVIGGGLIGAAIGTPSLLIGLGVSGYGHYSGHKILCMLGMGMMAANGFQKSSSSTNGLDGMDMASIKQRITTYKDSFVGKLYLDKVLHRKSTAKTATKEGTAGLGGDLQFFNYPNDAGYSDELNGELAALDRIEQQIEDSGRSRLPAGAQDYADADEAEVFDVAALNL